MKLNIKKVCIFLFITLLILPNFCYSEDFSSIHDQLQPQSAQGTSNPGIQAINKDITSAYQTAQIAGLISVASILLIPVVIIVFLIRLLVSKDKRVFFVANWLKHLVIIGILLLIPVGIYLYAAFTFRSILG